MTDPTNLTQLRQQAQQDLKYQQIGGLDTSYPLGVLALIDTAEAAREYRQYSTWHEYGDLGSQAFSRLHQALAKFSE